MTKTFETLREVFAPVMSGLEFKLEEYARQKRQTTAVLEVLQLHLHDFADTQIGSPPTDMAANQPTMQFSLAIRWPNQFHKLDSGAQSGLRDMLVDLLELGCVFHLLYTTVPMRPAPARVSDTQWLRTKRLSEAYAADYVMQQTEKEMYQGVGAALLKRVTDEKVAPIYKSQSILWRPIGMEFN